MPSLYPLKKEDIPKAVDSLKDAFKDDPLWAEIFKEESNKDEALSAFFTCPLLYGMKFGKVYAASPRLEGIAAWVHGKYSDMSMWRMLRCGALPYGMKMGKETIKNLNIIKQVVSDRERMMKGKPYIYILIIGISSPYQGKGLGSVLMDAIKKEADRDGFYIYLETEKEENLKFYKKHGFSVLQRIVFRKINLPMWELARKPGSLD